MDRIVLRAFLGFAIFLLPAELFGQDQAAFKAKVKPMVDAYCINCHGPDVAKAGLRLDTLKPDFHDAQTLAAWVRVHDKLANGEMPPPKMKNRPTQGEIDAATKFLNPELKVASLELQQKKGRVVLRRLNGTEFENTIHDLLGIDIPLKDMLPEDNSVAGFDNISAALELSPTHLLRYQEAAEKAIASTIPKNPPIPFSDKRTGREISKSGPNYRQTLDRTCYLKDDALVVYSKLPRYGLCGTASVPAAGRYKVSMSIAAVGAENKPVPVAFEILKSNDREGPVIFEMRDIPPGKPQVIEVEVDLEPRQSFDVNLEMVRDVTRAKKTIADYTGPGFLIEWLKIEGPVGPFPPARYNTLFDGVPLKARSVIKAESEGKKPPTINPNRPAQQWLSDPILPASANTKADSERLIRAFLPRAFRRPVSEELVKSYVVRVHDRLDKKDTFYDAMVYGYKSILSSPHFLLFMEPGLSTETKQGDLVSPKLDDYALASRLSYFLWSGPPDDELIALAKKGELTKPAVLRAQVDRMLNAPKAHRFTENFTGQWLDLRKIDATIPDPVLYGDFDGTLLWSMPRETHRFFEEVVKNDLSLLEFIDSDWTMLNERLARHYGIPGVEGNDFRKVKLPPSSHRGGVMTHASVLKVTADGTTTSPVLRGKWVLDRILGKPPAPPPPDVPALEPDIRGATTIRQQLDKHRNIPSCASCHIHIDPPGFALESFDPIGGYREFYRVTVRTKAGQIQIVGSTGGRGLFRGLDVEKGGKLADGRSFKTIEDYKKLLLSDKDQLVRNLTEKLLIYSTGADIQFADREIVEQIVAKLKTKNYGFRTLIHEVVQSRVFVNK